MLELIFQGFAEWLYGLILECWEHFSSSLLDIMSLDFAYLQAQIPILPVIQQILLAAGVQQTFSRAGAGCTAPCAFSWCPM